MSELITQDAVAASVVPEVGGDLVIAANPGEMQHAQATVIEWANAKLKASQDDLEDARQCHRTAIQAGWNKAPFSKRVRTAELTVNYYEKVVAALAEGYCIVPNFPVTVLAIKQNYTGPSGSIATGSWKPTGVEQQADSTLPLGVGEYVDPSAKCRELIEHREHYTDSTGKQTSIKTRWWEASEFRDVSLPVKFMKPRVLEATHHAMATKIFDEVGVMPARKKTDPVVIGRILGPGSKEMSFLISWFIDRSDL